MFLHNPQGIDVKSMGRIFIGLVKCGAWGCFDEFNRLEEAVLSAVSMQIQTIQAALKTKLPSTELLGRQVGIGRLSHRRRFCISAASPLPCVRRSDALSAPLFNIEMGITFYVSKVRQNFLKKCMNPIQTGAIAIPARSLAIVNRCRNFIG